MVGVGRTLPVPLARARALTDAAARNLADLNFRSSQPPFFVAIARSGRLINSSAALFGVQRLNGWAIHAVQRGANFSRRLIASLLLGV